jgi:hypothetical protein
VSPYDPAQHSKNKLGLAVHALILPDCPIGAQLSTESGIFHLMLPGGVYVGVYKPITLTLPEDWVAIAKTVGDLPTEPSYSGSGAEYRKLHIDQIEGIGPGMFADKPILIRAGEQGPILARVYVDPSIPVASTDEDPLTGQSLKPPTAKGQTKGAKGAANIPGITTAEPDNAPEPADDLDGPDQEPDEDKPEIE